MNNEKNIEYTPEELKAIEFTKPFEKQFPEIENLYKLKIFLDKEYKDTVDEYNFAAFVDELMTHYGETASPHYELHNWETKSKQTEEFSYEAEAVEIAEDEWEVKYTF